MNTRQIFYVMGVIIVSAWAWSYLLMALGLKLVDWRLFPFLVTAVFFTIALMIVAEMVGRDG